MSLGSVPGASCRRSPSEAEERQRNAVVGGTFLRRPAVEVGTGGRITANAPNRNGRGGGTAVLRSSTSYGTTSQHALPEPGEGPGPVALEGEGALAAPED